MDAIPPTIVNRSKWVRACIASDWWWSSQSHAVVTQARKLANTQHLNFEKCRRSDRWFYDNKYLILKNSNESLELEREHKCQKEERERTKHRKGENEPTENTKEKKSRGVLIEATGTSSSCAPPESSSTTSFTATSSSSKGSSRSPTFDAPPEFQKPRRVDGIPTEYDETTGGPSPRSSASDLSNKLFGAISSSPRKTPVGMCLIAAYMMSPGKSSQAKVDFRKKTKHGTFEKV